MRKKMSVIWITILWFICVILLGIIGGLIAEGKASGGEQKFFTSIVWSIIIGLIGAAIIIAIYLFGNRGKDRSASIYFLVVALIILMPLIIGIISDVSSVFGGYDELEQTRYAGSDEIDIKIQYYDIDKSENGVQHIRSERFWRNGKKDSTWTVYAKDGGVISQKRYKGGALIESIR